MRYLLFYILLFTFPTLSALSLADILGERMVLQQGDNTRIWGTANSNEKISVQFRSDKIYSTYADNRGFWSIAIKAGKPGGPFSLLVEGERENINLKEVYVGDVWLAGGQSNMFFRLMDHVDSKNYIDETSDSDIRYLRIPVAMRNSPKESVEWKKINPDNAGWFSAVAYFFAKELKKHLDYPIGIISCNRGSTSAEAWISEKRMSTDPLLIPYFDKHKEAASKYTDEEYEQKLDEFRVLREKYDASLKTDKPIKNKPYEPMGYNHPDYSTGMYSNMLNRVVPMTLKGVIWYQGETNVKDSEGYKIIFPALINDWRNLFMDKDLPFYFVQLSNFDERRTDDEAWARLREVQQTVANTDHNVGMAVSIDYGDKTDIHPQNKKPVGERLARLALNKTYKVKVPYKGPSLRKVRIENDKIILHFKDVYQGLKMSDKEMKAFYVCGSDSVFHLAKAKIINKNTIVLSASNVKQPQKVRYKYLNWSEGDIYNSEDIPCAPFRTDSFSRINSK